MTSNRFRNSTNRWRQLVDVCGGKVDKAYEEIREVQNTHKKNGVLINVTKAIEIAIRKITRREEESNRV